MQSKFHFLSSGKLGLVRPWIPGPIASLTLKSDLRAPLCLQPGFEQHRLNTTCADNIEEDIASNHGALKQLPRSPNQPRSRQDEQDASQVEPVPQESSAQNNWRFRQRIWKPLIASHRSRRGIPSPSVLLGKYLDIEDSVARTKFFAGAATYLDPTRLPSILLSYLHATSNSNISSASLDKSFFLSARQYLTKRGITVEDIAHWDWILAADSADGRIDRFFASATSKPHFLLLEILRRDFREVASLSKILVYLIEDNFAAHSNEIGNLKIAHLSSTNTMHQNAFGVLISRLLRQARRIWPPAMVTIAQMVEPYFNSMTKNNVSLEDTPAKSAQLSELLNYFIELLSVHTKANPLASAGHNWKAQRVMLELAGKFDPPLVLSQSSYRSVVQTLAATRKSDNESKSAVLRTRTWPPWRQDEDGMDARRLLEEDFSRVILAMFRSQEAGYRQDGWDESMGIYGGMEPDGTPSIQTRRGMRKIRESSDTSHMSSLVWTARVEATRDVQEAWGAFLEFRTRGGIPKQDLFFAMFQKLNSDLAVTGRKRSYSAPPGDGREVMTVSNDNYTPYYIQKVQHPTTSMLYKEMLDMGIRPSGRCLNFLIRKARTTDEGLRYLLDGGIDRTAVRVLAEGSSSLASPSALQKIPEAVLFAYISLTCRLAARAVVKDTDWASQSKESSLLPRFTFLEQMISGQKSTTWTVLEQRPSNPRHIRTRETFNHVAFLITQSSTSFRPVWYAYFSALAKEGAVIAREVVGNPKWDSLAWQRIKRAVEDFHSAGLELEPEGFHHMCVCFEKFAGGPIGRFTKRYAGSASEEVKILRATFAKLSEGQDRSQGVPSLFHAIRGVHLHAYIRALGAADDHEGIMSALEWMVKYNTELESIAQENRNGVSGFRKAITVIRYLLQRSEYLDDAKELVTRVTWWGHWPSEDDVFSYMRGSRVDMVEDIVEEEEEDLGGRRLQTF